MSLFLNFVGEATTSEELTASKNGLNGGKGVGMVINFSSLNPWNADSGMLYRFAGPCRVKKPGGGGGGEESPIKMTGFLVGNVLRHL